MTLPQCELLIIGASARAAAMSAVRSGVAPWAIDRFADLDLREHATARRIADFAADLDIALADAPPGPWMYTGAIENRPELIDRISRQRQLLGIGGESLRAVRDPFRVFAALREAGLNAPQCAGSPADLSRNCSWLRKPLSSDGGCGITSWNRDEVKGALAQASRRKSQAFFQQRIDGRPAAAIYVAADRQAELLGVTRQLLGLDWCGFDLSLADRFRYCGSIGPLRLSSPLANQFARIGNTLANAFELQGLFGVDAIVAGSQTASGGLLDGEAWPVEVNPRYTASVEILERAFGIHAIALHLAACRGKPLEHPQSVQSQSASRAYCGKAILFAHGDMVVSAEFSDLYQQQNPERAWPLMADIPPPGSTIRAGQPIVTLLAEGPSEAEVLARLKSLAAEAYMRADKGIEICRNYRR